jgi:hypothetical protein
MGEQSATRLKGDDFQHLYSWFELLCLLDFNSPYDYGFVEHPSAGAADDVTLHSHLEIAPPKYIQLKFHVDQRHQYSSLSMVATPVRSGRPLLHQLFESWKQLRGGAQTPEIWLVSNWGCTAEIGRFICDSCMLSEEFHSGGMRSDAGKIKTLWRQRLGCSERQFAEFSRSLRLRLGFAGLHELREKVNDRMGRYGLQTGSAAQAIALDIVRTWIKQGGDRKRIDRQMLHSTVQDRGLTLLQREALPICFYAQ